MDRSAATDKEFMKSVVVPHVSAEGERLGLMLSRQLAPFIAARLADVQRRGGERAQSCVALSQHVV